MNRSSSSDSSSTAAGSVSDPVLSWFVSFEWALYYSSFVSPQLAKSWERAPKKTSIGHDFNFPYKILRQHIRKE